MTDLPIACTLSQGELAKVKEEYRASQHLYQANAHFDGNAAVLLVRGEKEPLGRFLRSMVAREAQCCAFLAFDLAETADGYRLRLGSDSLDAQSLRIVVEMLFPSATLEVQS